VFVNPWDRRPWVEIPPLSCGASSRGDGPAPVPHMHLPYVGGLHGGACP
jgi:hypothetical protein